MPEPSADSLRYTFKCDKLYIFDRDSVEVIRPWGARAGAWTLRFGSTWKPFAPPFTISCYKRWIALQNMSQTQRYRAGALSAFLASIPRPALASVQPFRKGNWQLLQLINRCGSPALELTKSNPAMAVLLANRRWFDCPIRTAPVDAVRRVLRKPRKEIALKLGFPGGETTVKVLRKIPSSSVAIRLLRALADALADEEARELLRHVPRLNARTIWIIADKQLRRQVTFSFIESVCRDGPWDFSTQEIFALREVNELAVRLQITLPRFSSIDMVRSWHDRLTDYCHSFSPELSGAPPVFPPAPLRNNTNIQAIATPAALISEGIEMHHCVASYIWDVAERRRYFYAMKSPRATICLRLNGATWGIEDIRGPLNSRLNIGVFFAVREWLSDVQPEPSCLSKVEGLFDSTVQTMAFLHDVSGGSQPAPNEMDMPQRKCCTDPPDWVVKDIECRYPAGSLDHAEGGRGGA